MKTPKMKKRQRENSPPETLGSLFDEYSDNDESFTGFKSDVSSLLLSPSFR